MGRTLKALELGCGKTPFEMEGLEVTHLDSAELPDVDIIHDLNEFPWPFEDESFDMVLAFHILEHLEDFPRAMGEIHRILRDGGLLVVRVPHFRHWMAFSDMTHQGFFTLCSFNHYDPKTLAGKRFGHETDEVGFRVVSQRVTYLPLDMRRNRLIRAVSAPFAALLSFMTNNMTFVMEELIFPFLSPREALFLISKGEPDSKIVEMGRMIENLYDFKMRFDT